MNRIHEKTITPKIQLAFNITSFLRMLISRKKDSFNKKKNSCHKDLNVMKKKFEKMPEEE